jgi:hypothetical protein
MPKSASWSVILTTAVPDGASTELLTPGLDPAAIDPESAELAVGNAVVPMPEKATVDYGDGSVATITNATGEEWPSGATVYLYVEGKGVSEDLEEQLASMQSGIDANSSAITDLEAEVNANTEAIAALQPAVDKNVADIADLQTRVAALEAAAPPATMSASKK